jgi:hypothetical protein
MSAISAIADAVVAKLSSATLPLTIQAERAYRLTRDMRFAGVKVLVIPDTLAISGRDMHPSSYLHWRVGVWIQAVCSGTVEEVDPLMELLEDVAVLFAFKPLPGHVAQCTAVESAPPIDPSQLDTKGLFLSGLFLTFRTARP